MAHRTSAYLSSIERLPDIHERLMRVLIEHSDFRRILTIYDTPETLFYVDPPYVSETRRGGQYLYEMTERDHSDLVSLLLNVSGMAIVSGYKHKIYERLEEVGWKCFEIRKTCSLVGRTTAAGLQGRGSLSNQGRRECIWVSPNTMGEVDYEAIFKK